MKSIHLPSLLTAATLASWSVSLLFNVTSGFSIKKNQMQPSPRKHQSNKSLQMMEDRATFIQNAFKFTFTAASVSASVSIPLILSSPQPVLAASHSKDIPTIGTKAPYFSLPSSRTEDKGVEINLNQLCSSGKWTVLYFYPGAFTSGCTLEARGFQRDINEYKDLNTQIVGVSVDSVEKNAQFCTEEKLDYALLTDEGGKVSKAYGSALSIPGFGTFSNRQTYIIDPDGNVKYVFTDVESRVARHSTEVLEKLKELQS